MPIFRKGAGGLLFPRGGRESVELLVLVALLFLAVGMWIGIWISGANFYKPAYRVAIPVEIWAVQIIVGVFGFLSFVALKSLYVMGVTRTRRLSLLLGFLLFAVLALGTYEVYGDSSIAGFFLTSVGAVMWLVFFWYWVNVPIWMILYFEILLWPLLAGVLGPDNPGIAMGSHGGAGILFGMWYAPDRISLKRFLLPSRGVL